MTKATATVKALVFDVFGTVVDWRSALLAEADALAAAKGWTVDWPAFIEAWEGVRKPIMAKVNSGEMPWINLSQIYRRRLDEVLAEFGLGDMTDAEKDRFNRVWCRPNVWPDSRPALVRLKKKFLLATLTNNDFAWAVAMAKHADLPWDCILTSEVFGRYKPAPETYQGVLRLLGLRPDEAMMVACHNYDLANAATHGYRTGFIPRKEFSDRQTKDQGPEGDWDIVGKDLGDVAAQLGA